MVYKYEAEILKYINRVFPSIKLMTYAKQQDMFNAMSQVTKYPAFFYYREPTEWTYNKLLPILDSNNRANFVFFDQKYVGRILLKDQFDAQKFASKLRFYWLKNSYITFSSEEDNIDNLKVGLRLLYIKIDEDRAPDNTKGAMRFVEFEWASQLFFSDIDNDVALTTGINLYLSLNQDFSVSLINDGNLIKTF